MLAQLVFPLVLCVGRQDEHSSAAAPPHTMMELGWSLPLDELVPRLARSMLAYRFRRIELASIDPRAMPKAFEDGIVCVHAEPGALTVEEIVIARDKESIELFPRRKVDQYSLLRGETCSLMMELGWVRPSILLYSPCPMPVWVYTLEGLVEPERASARSISDTESRSIAHAREATFASPSADSIRLTYTLEPSARALRLEVARRDGAFETTTWMGAVRDPDSGIESPLAVLHTIRRGAEPTLVELWTRIAIDRTCAATCAVPPCAELLDLRVPDEDASSSWTDRVSTLSELFEADTRPVPRDARAAAQLIPCAQVAQRAREAREHGSASSSLLPMHASIGAAHDLPRAAIAVHASAELVPIATSTIELTEAERRALAIAGIGISAPCASAGIASASRCMHAHTFLDAFEIPGFFSAALEQACADDQPLFVFAPIGGDDGALDALAPCSRCGCALEASSLSPAPYYAWLASRLRSRLATGEPVLRFEQVGCTEYGIATMRFALRSDPTREAVITGFHAGCGVELLDALPIRVGRTSRELRFRCSLSRPRPSAGNMIVRIELADEPSLILPMSIDAPHPRAVVTPPRLEFADEPDDERVVTIESPLAMRAIEIVRVPACIEIASTDARSDRIVLSVRETPCAEQHHACGAILALAQFTNGDHPETLRIEIRHACKARDDSHVRELNGVFVPGEELVLCRHPRGDMTIACPDRIPCALEMLAGAGYARIASTKVPSREGAFAWNVDGSDGALPTVRVRGRASERLNSSWPGWARMCE
jgi:hypothetical protein